MKRMSNPNLVGLLIPQGSSRTFSGTVRTETIDVGASQSGPVVPPEKVCGSLGIKSLQFYNFGPHLEDFGGVSCFHHLFREKSRSGRGPQLDVPRPSGRHRSPVATVSAVRPSFGFGFGLGFLGALLG